MNNKEKIIDRLIAENSISEHTATILQTEIWEGFGNVIQEKLNNKLNEIDGLVEKGLITEDEAITLQEDGVKIWGSHVYPVLPFEKNEWLPSSKDKETEKCLCNIEPKGCKCD